MDTPDLCADVIAHCECVRAAGHDDPHVCFCNGSWNADGSIVAFPEGRTAEEAAQAFLDLLGPPPLRNPWLGVPGIGGMYGQ